MLSDKDLESIQNFTSHAVQGLGNVMDKAQDAVQGLGNVMDKAQDAVRGLGNVMDKAQNAFQGQGNVVDSGREALKNRPEHKAPAIYKKVDGEINKKKMKSVFGYTLSLAGSVLMIATAFTVGTAGIAVSSGGSLVFGGLLIAAGLPIGIGGTREAGKLSRFRSYVSAIGSKTVISLQKLADYTGKSLQFVTRDVQEMVGDRLFLQGHVTDEKNELIVTDDTYAQYKQLSGRMAEEKREKEAKDQALKDYGLSPLGMSIIREGEDYIQKIHAANEELPQEVISEKLNTLERMINRILEELKKQPDKAFELRKMTNYYLPTVWKLLDAYRTIEKEPDKTAAMVETEKKIEASIDEINEAFSLLLDRLFQHRVMDVNSDMTVLHQMLKQDNLKESDFKKKES